MGRKCVICGKELTHKKQKWTCGSYECHKTRMRLVARLKLQGKDTTHLGSFNSILTMQEKIESNLHILFDDKLSAQEKARRLNIDKFSTLSYYFYKYRSKYPEYKDCRLWIDNTDTDNNIYKQYKDKYNKLKQRYRDNKRKSKIFTEYEDYKAAQLLKKLGVKK